jgi:hypothetical protein
MELKSNVDFAVAIWKTLSCVWLWMGLRQSQNHKVTVNQQKVVELPNMGEFL